MKKDTLTSTVDTIASECLAVRIRLLNRTVTHIFDEALRPLKVKVSQLNVLMVVEHHIRRFLSTSVKRGSQGRG